MITIEDFERCALRALGDLKMIHSAYPDAELVRTFRDFSIWGSPSLKPTDCNFVIAIPDTERRPTLRAARRFGESLVILRDRFAGYEDPINAALQLLRDEQPAAHAELLAFVAGQQL